MKSLFHLCHFKGQGAGFDPTTLPDSVGKSGDANRYMGDARCFSLLDITTGIFGIHEALQALGKDSCVVTTCGKPIATLHFHAKAGEGYMAPEDGGGNSIACVFTGRGTTVISQAIRACVKTGKPTELALQRGRKGEVLDASVRPLPPL